MVQDIWSLTDDPDNHVAFLACSLCLSHVPPVAVDKVTLRLIDLLERSEWMLRDDIKDLLATHFSICRPAIQRRLRTASGATVSALQQIAQRGRAPRGQ